jgi:hypothetical protein
MQREVTMIAGMCSVICLLGIILQMAGCAVTVPDPAVARADAERAGVALEVTRQAAAFRAEREALALERERLNLEREQVRAQSGDLFRMALPWVILLAGLGAAGLVLWRWLQVWEARARLYTRAPEAGETILTLGRGDRFALPLRSGNVYQDLTHGAERSPMLASSAGAQEAATMRQQAGNLALASNAHETVKARTGGGDVTLMLPQENREPAQALPAPSPVRVLPEPTEAVSGWIVDTERALLPGVISDGD